MDSQLRSSTIQAHIRISPDKRDENGFFAVDRLRIGNYTGIDFPVEFQQEHGNKLKDNLDTGNPSFFLFSDRIIHTITQAKLTGWKAFPVKVMDKKGGEIKGYQGFSVIGKCGAIDYTKSSIIQKRYVPEGPLCSFYEGLHIGLDSWDGSDFFLPKSYFGHIISKKAADIFNENKFTNVELENLTDVEIDVDMVQRNSIASRKWINPKSPLDLDVNHNQYSKLMAAKSNDELQRIICFQREDYQPEAVEAAEMELHSRELTDEEQENAWESAEKDIQAENDKAGVPLEWHWRILAMLLPGVINWFLAFLFENKGYVRKRKEAWRWTSFGLVFYALLIFILKVFGG